MTYRDDTAARSALADADAHGRKHLPMLDRIEIASPCDRKWDDMMRTADERVRAGVRRVQQARLQRLRG